MVVKVSLQTICNNPSFVFLLFWLFWFLLTPSLCILSVLWRALSCLFPFYCLLSLVFILCPRPILATRSLSPPLALLVPPIIKTLVLCVFPPSRLPSALFSTVTFCCPFPPGVLSVVRLLTCAVALRVYLFSLVICGCNKLVGKSFSILSLSSSLVSCITQHLLLTFLSVSLYSCLSLFFSSLFLPAPDASTVCVLCFITLSYVTGSLGEWAQMWTFVCIVLVLHRHSAVLLLSHFMHV